MRLFKQETFYTLDAKEAEELICSQFSKPDYDIADAEDFKRYSSNEFEVLVSAYTDRERKQVAEFIEADSHYLYHGNLPALLNELAARKCIPEGKYLIRYDK